MSKWNNHLKGVYRDGYACRMQFAANNNTPPKDVRTICPYSQTADSEEFHYWVNGWFDAQWELAYQLEA